MAEPDPPKADRSRRILVLGLGNILLRDEGVGAHVVALLQKEPLPADVEVVDGGTAALDALLLAQRA
ncbi:MAG: hydrogenase maturation protease [Sedimentisphaerales bacterium]|nr:hydrogenase maturation protease [Sedimentisphaerales bacterium]